MDRSGSAPGPQAPAFTGGTASHHLRTKANAPKSCWQRRRWTGTSFCGSCDMMASHALPSVKPSAENILVCCRYRSRWIGSKPWLPTTRALRRDPFPHSVNLWTPSRMSTSTPETVWPLRRVGPDRSGRWRYPRGPLHSASCSEALRDVPSVLRFHVESFGPDVLEAFVAETTICWRCRRLLERSPYSSRTIP